MSLVDDILSGGQPLWHIPATVIDTERRLGVTMAALRFMAERFDGATNGKCHFCGAGRVSGGWDFGRTNSVGVPGPCSNESCRSHAVRAILYRRRPDRWASP